MKSSARFRFWLLCIGVFVLVSGLVRLGLAGWIATEGHSAGGLAGAVAIGILHDLCMGFALGLPFLIGLYLLGFVWRRAAGRWLAHLLLIAFCGVLVFSSVAEFFFWNELDRKSTRLNSSH